MRLIVCGLLLAATVAASCGGAQPEGPEPPDAVPEGAVLIVGNSLTASNDLPGLIEGLSAAAGDERPVSTWAVTSAGYSLEDHWHASSARATVERGGWALVVLQQGPSSLPESQMHLATWTETWTELIREHGAEPALYMVWPSEQRSFAFDAVSESYRNAAQAVDGHLFPVGEAWRAAWRREPDLPLYGPDGFHPSITGSYLAAIVIYAQVSGRSPVGLPHEFERPGGGSVSIDEDRATLLQEAAAEAIEAFGR
ncbi:MAG: hypothetical protein ACODAE_09220 [Gemmatimonadota bacterium]